MNTDDPLHDWIEPLESVETAGVDPVTILPGPDAKNQRLDRFLANELSDLSRVFLQRLIDQGDVLVDGVPRRQSFKLTPGERIEVRVPPPEQVEIVPQRIPLDIVFEHSDLIVINKPAGMVVHPAPGHLDGTLVNALAWHSPGIAIGGLSRPGIVHRLDKDTSGLIVVAKTDRGHSTLIRQWGDRSVDKHYIALVRGEVEDDQATIDAPIGRNPKDRMRMAVVASGRDAVTHFDVETRFEGATLLNVQIDTGRTHQVRVHLQFIGHPIVGDHVYNPAKGPYGGKSAIVNRQFLHAARLGFAMPDGEWVEFAAPLPADLAKAQARTGESG